MRFNGKKDHGMRDRADGTRAEMQTITAADFGGLVTNEDHFFLYLQNFDTDPTDLVSSVDPTTSVTDNLQALVRSVVTPHLASVSAYTSSDPQFYTELAMEDPPTSSLLVFSSHARQPVASLSFPASYDKLARFVDTHRFPTLVQLTAANHRELFESPSKATVVLAALHSGEQGEAEHKKLLEVARSWHHGERDLGQPVWFAWAEGDKWAKWLRKSYGIKPGMYPAVVVVEPAVCTLGPVARPQS